MCPPLVQQARADYRSPAPLSVTAAQDTCQITVRESSAAVRLSPARDGGGERRMRRDGMSDKPAYVGVCLVGSKVIGT